MNFKYEACTYDEKKSPDSTQVLNSIQRDSYNYYTCVITDVATL